MRECRHGAGSSGRFPGQYQESVILDADAARADEGGEIGASPVARVGVQDEVPRVILRCDRPERFGTRAVEVELLVGWQPAQSASWL